MPATRAPIPTGATCWLYLAVSSEKQAETLADQERWARQVAGENGWRISRVFGAGREGIASGKAGVRRHLAALIAELERTPADRRPDWLLMIRTDRVGRGTRIVDSQIALHSIVDMGVRIFTRDVGELRLRSATDQIISAVKSGLATLENEVKRDKALAHFARKRAAGLPTSRRVPFGLRREGEQFVADEDTAPIVREMDRKYLSGEPIADLLRWLSTAHPRAWHSHAGVHRAIRDARGYYLAAGVRTRETQDALRNLARSRLRGSGRYGKHQHALRGVFVCGRCVDSGFAPEDSKMGAELVGYGSRPLVPTIVCQRAAGRAKRHPMFVVRGGRVEAAWRAFLALIARQLRTDAAAEGWAPRNDDAGEKRRRLQRSLAQMDAEEARLRTRLERADKLLGDDSPAVVRQVRALLESIDRDEMALRLRREATSDELRRLGSRTRDGKWLREHLERFERVYDGLSAGEKNAWNRQLCAAVGSHPVVRRPDGGRWAPLVISWPAVVREPVVVEPDGTLRPGRHPSPGRPRVPRRELVGVS